MSSKITFDETSVVTLKDLDLAGVEALAAWCKVASSYDSPRYKAQQEIWTREFQERAKRREEERKAAKSVFPRVLEYLKKNLKPGDRLKMRGCKDGKGLREFIRWDNDYIVCWQIKTRRVLVNTMAPQQGFRTVLENTNQVTTHMADKVQGFVVDGTLVPIKNFVK